MAVHLQTPLPSANIWPHTLKMTFCTFLCAAQLLLMESVESRDLLRFGPDLSLLQPPLLVGLVWHLIPAASVVATWQDERRCQVVQVCVVAGMTTPVDVDFGPAWLSLRANKDFKCFQHHGANLEVVLSRISANIGWSSLWSLKQRKCIFDLICPLQGVTLTRDCSDSNVYAWT